MVFMFIVFVIVVIIIFFFFMMFLYLMNPCGRRSNIIEIKHIGVDEFVEVNISVIAIDNLRFWLNGANDLPCFFQLMRFYVCCFIEQDDIAEFNLLNHQVLYIFIINILSHQVVSTFKFVSHTQSINHGDDTIETWHSVACYFGSHRWNRTNGLCDRSWFANAACLNHDIIETVHSDDVLQLLYKIHLQRTTNTTVL